MRVRLRFSKVGKVRFTSHRDVAGMWERALRKADLPVVYTEGFSPRPKLHFGLALSNGHESLAEYLDADLIGEIDLESLPERTTAVLPAGLTVTGAARAAATALVLRRTRKGEERDDDVRPAIEALTVDATPDGPQLDALLATQPRGLRPTELLAAVFPQHPEPEYAWRRVLRVQQFIERDGSRRELPPLAAAPAPHALEPACA
jgi:Uncharacterized protein conserved in bacteria (DUF2344)